MGRATNPKNPIKSRQRPQSAAATLQMTSGHHPDNPNNLEHLGESVVLPSPPAADQLFGRAPSATAAPGTATTAAQTIASQLGPAAIPSTAETEKTTPAFLSAQASDREAWARASEAPNIPRNPHNLDNPNKVLLGPNRGGGGELYLDLKRGEVLVKRSIYYQCRSVACATTEPCRGSSAYCVL